MDEIPADYWLGIDQFNQREFYACHDTLEAVWINAPPVDKNFFQGILQIAVALYHLGNANQRGALILLGEGIHRLRSYPEEYGAIAVESLVEAAITLLKQLQLATPAQIQAIAQQLQAGHATLTTEDGTILTLPVIQRMDQ